MAHKMTQMIVLMVVVLSCHGSVAKDDSSAGPSVDRMRRFISIVFGDNQGSSRPTNAGNHGYAYGSSYDNYNSQTSSSHGSYGNDNSDEYDDYYDYYYDDEDYGGDYYDYEYDYEDKRRQASNQNKPSPLLSLIKRAINSHKRSKRSVGQVQESHQKKDTKDLEFSKRFMATVFGGGGGGGSPHGNAQSNFRYGSSNNYGGRYEQSSEEYYDDDYYYDDEYYDDYGEDYKRGLARAANQLKSSSKRFVGTGTVFGGSQSSNAHHNSNIGGYQYGSSGGKRAAKQLKPSTKRFVGTGTVFGGSQSSNAHHNSNNGGYQYGSSGGKRAAKQLKPSSKRFVGTGTVFGGSQSSNAHHNSNIGGYQYGSSGGKRHATELGTVFGGLARAAKQLEPSSKRFVGTGTVFGGSQSSNAHHNSNNGGYKYGSSGWKRHATKLRTLNQIKHPKD